MPATLLLPGGVAPSNLILKPGASARLVESDLYDIAKRIREISPRLYLIEVDDDPRYDFIVMEHCDDGIERLVFSVRRQDLDARCLTKLAEIAHTPLDEKLRKLEAMEYKWEAERKEEALEQLYEDMGKPMWAELERCGFIQRPVSYPKIGVASGGRRAR